MNRFRAIFVVITFILLPTVGLPQNQDGSVRYMAQVDGKELVIRLVSDSTYEASTIWGPSYGYYEIVPQKDNPSYDKIIFADMVYDTKDAFFFYHIPIPQEVAKSLVDPDLYSEDSFYVAMYDLTGEFVAYHDVCFADAAGNLILCDYNKSGGRAQRIPSGTSSIGMIGEQRNYTTYFKSGYDRTQGSIAYVIGPSADRFLIKKDRSCIVYRPCYCDDMDSGSGCCVVFAKAAPSCATAVPEHAGQSASFMCEKEYTKCEVIVGIETPDNCVVERSEPILADPQEAIGFLCGRHLKRVKNIKFYGTYCIRLYYGNEECDLLVVSESKRFIRFNGATYRLKGKETKRLDKIITNMIGNE